MGLDFCTECQTIEGEWTEDEAGTEICCECGAEGSHKGIPEHDDYDLER